MDQLYVVTHPDPLVLDVRAIDHESTPDGAVALAYFHRGHLLARGVVTPDAVEAIRGLLSEPVSLALAATEDEEGNIDARVCLVLPVDGRAAFEEGAGDEPEEPWRASVPTPPPEVEAGYAASTPESEEEKARLALLPIGNVVRGFRHRNHTDVAADAREMLDNLISGRAQDAVTRAIDDLLDSI